MNPLRSDLPPLPERIARLPVGANGYPIPWFVVWIDGQPEFRVADSAKYVLAVRQKLCWVCGEPLGAYLGFVLGPMCAVNRISAEPPSHRECAEFSLRSCPFLSKPQMVRRENDRPDGNCAGVMIESNPGVSLLWMTKSRTRISAPGGMLFQVGDPTELRPYRFGRPATLAELMTVFEERLPILREIAEKEGADAVACLETEAAKARQLFARFVKEGMPA